MPFTVLDPSTAATAPSTTVGAPLTSVGETLASMQTELVAQLQARADVAAATTRMTKWINWGYLNIAQMLDLTELWGSVGLSLVASQPLYKIPTVVSWIKRIGLEDLTDYPDTGGFEMEMIDEPTYRMLPDSSTFGTLSPLIPQKYFRFGRMVVLWPTPDTTYTAALDFRVRPANLANPTDSPILPSEFHEAIFYAGKERACRALKLYQDAAVAQNDKLSVLRPLLNTDAEERTAMHMSLAPVRSRSQLYQA